MVLRLRRRRRVRAIFGVGILEMDFRDPRKVVADEFDRGRAAQGQMRGIRCQPDIFRIGQRQHRADFMLAFHRSPNMGMGSQPDPEGYRLSADLVECIGQPLELILVRAAFRAATHITLPMVAAARRKKIAREAHHFSDQFSISIHLKPGTRPTSAATSATASGTQSHALSGWAPRERQIAP